LFTLSTPRACRAYIGAQRVDRDGYLVRDTQDEKNQAFRVTSQLQLDNPGHNGLYELLLDPNKFERCLVLVGPYSFRGREPDGLATGVKAEGHATANYKVHELFHGARAEQEAFRTWFDGLPDTKPEVGSTYVFVTPRGTGTVPMGIQRTLDSPGKAGKITALQFAGRAELNRVDHEGFLHGTHRRTCNEVLGFRHDVQHNDMVHIRNLINPIITRVENHGVSVARVLSGFRTFPIGKHRYT